ncbi:hypothetical protein OED52_13810 [Rhodococcus sp. Z13]|uniref:Uncharacterized protein n=1 Tax=Rhodococcus sacchari TaxID=2962047 RepID=A0ACD4DCP3_9NOCA|nr:hypothetical protein [Rhodococcus sp. Z13]UYP17748.1 hypothetical protein OED52_13810 [Rhodococcus sp. Z13]
MVNVCACGHEKAAHWLIVTDGEPPWCTECQCTAYVPESES